jgi:hypothetical protein
MGTRLHRKRARQRIQPRLEQGQHPAQAQGKAGVHDVLRRGAPMGILRVFGRGHSRAERRHECGNRHAVARRRLRQRGRVDQHLLRGAVDEGRAFGGDHPHPRLCLGQRPLDQQHRAQLGAVGKQPPDLGVAQHRAVKR